MINVAEIRRDIAFGNGDLVSMFFAGPNPSTWYSASTRGVTKQVPHHNDAEGNAQHPSNHVAHANLRQPALQKGGRPLASQSYCCRKSLSDTDIIPRARDSKARRARTEH